MSWKWPKLDLWNEGMPNQGADFRRQKQHNWDALRAWAHRMKDGLGNYSDELDTKLTDFDQRFSDQINGSTDNDEVIDARRPYGQSAYDTLGKRLDDMPSDAEIDADVSDTDDIAGALSDTMKAGLDSFIETLPSDGFKVAVISDSHFEDHYDTSYFGTYKYTKDTYEHLNAFNYLAKVANVLIANGDNTNGNNPDVANTIAETATFADKILMQSNTADKYILPGNHDDNTAFKYSQYNNNQTILPIMPSNIISKDQFKQLFKTNDLINGESRDNGSIYFYKDYAAQKIRLIGLDSEDLPQDVLNDDGSVKYDRYWYHTYSQAQMNWLVGTALTGVPDGYQVMIISHAPVDGTADKLQFNQDLMVGLLNAFATGQSFSGASVDAVPTELKIDVNADFTSQGARTIIGAFAGHIHRESMTTENNFVVPTFTCDANKSADQVGTDKAMALYVITVQTDQRLVTISGFGHTTTRTYNY